MPAAISTPWGSFPPGRRVYVSAVPARPLAAQIDVACRLAAAGFEPIPHLAARRFASSAALDFHLARLAEGASVRRVLVIGGDIATRAGPFHAAIEVIESGLLQAAASSRSASPAIRTAIPGSPPTTSIGRSRPSSKRRERPGSACTLSPGYAYERAPDQQHFLNRRKTKELFRGIFPPGAEEVVVQSVVDVP